MAGITPPDIPGDDAQAQSEYDWTQRMLDLGRDYTRVGQRGPFSRTYWNGNELTQEYDPAIEGDFRGILDTRAQMRSRLAQALQGFDPQNIPAAVDHIAPTPMQLGYDRGGFTDYSAGDLMSGYGRGGFLGIPGADDFLGERQRVEDAVFDRSAKRLDKRFARQKSDTEVALRNKGFVGGSEGFDRSMGDLAEAENDAYSSAMNDAVLAGGAEQSRLLADALRIRGQQNFEGLTDVDLWNRAQGTDFGQRMAMRGLEGQESQQDLENYNTGMGINFGQRMASGDFQNRIRGQRYGEERDKFTLPFELASRMDQDPMLPQMHSGTVGLAQPRTPTWQDFQRMDYDAELGRSNWNTAMLQDLISGFGSAFGGGGSGGGGGGLGGAVGGAAGWLRNLFGGGSQGMWDEPNPEWGMGSGDEDWVEPEFDPGSVPEWDFGGSEWWNDVPFEDIDWSFGYGG